MIDNLSDLKDEASRLKINIKNDHFDLEGKKEILLNTLQRFINSIQGNPSHKKVRRASQILDDYIIDMIDWKSNLSDKLRELSKEARKLARKHEYNSD